MKPQSKIRTWLWLILLLIIFFTISILSFTPKPQSYPDYVADSPSPTGVKAIFTYLKKEMSVGIWAQPPNLLSSNRGQTLLIMVEPSMLLKNDEIQNYRSFMEKGNTILILTDKPNGLFEVKTSLYSNDGSSITYDANNKTRQSVVDSHFRLKSNSNDQILFRDRGGTIALKRSFGKGQLIAAVTPKWITNENILKYDHLQLILSLIKESGENTVLFDEYIHGVQSTSARMHAFPMWFLLLLLQGIIFTDLWLWNKGKRFGPIFTPREETVRYSDEGIIALSSWYLREHRYRESLSIQADYVKLLLQERWHIPYNKEWQELANLLEIKWTKTPSKEIHPFLSGLASILKKEKISKQEYLLWSRKLEQLRKEAEE